MSFLNYKFRLLLIIKFLIIFSSSDATAISGYEINKKLKVWLSEKNILSNPSFSVNKIYKVCKNKIKFEKVYENFSLIRVFCPDKGGWEIFIKTNISKKAKEKIRKNDLKKIIILKYSHEKGDIVDEDSLVYVYKKVNSSFFTNKNEIIGRKLKQNLKKGQIIKPRHLFRKFAVNQGDPVTIKSNIGLISVTSSGIAVNSGNIGDLIEVTNVRSGKIIKGFLKKNKIIQVYR